MNRKHPTPAHYAQKTINVRTGGRGTVEISAELAAAIRTMEIETGLCHVFLHHTSASLILCENADRDVRIDLETFMSKLVPDGDTMFIHTAEGADDMPAHVRTVLTQSELTLPISQGKLALGTWQGIYLWEHRVASHDRRITVTAHGAGA